MHSIRKDEYGWWDVSDDETGELLANFARQEHAELFVRALDSQGERGEECDVGG